MGVWLVWVFGGLTFPVVRDLDRAMTDDSVLPNRSTAVAEWSDDRPFARSYWVVPGRFLAGAYPASPAVEETRWKLGRLLDGGIRYLINLTEPGEVNRLGQPLVQYGSVIEEIAADRRVEVTCVRRRIPDLSVPSVDEMRELLNEIDRAVEREIPVYIHCLGGIGRTGTVVGCYLLRHGMADSESVMDALAALRRPDPASDLPSPETRRQRRFLRSWPTAERFPDGGGVRDR